MAPHSRTQQQLTSSRSLSLRVRARGTPWRGPHLGRRAASASLGWRLEAGLNFPRLPLARLSDWAACEEKYLNKFSCAQHFATSDVIHSPVSPPWPVSVSAPPPWAYNSRHHYCMFIGHASNTLLVSILFWEKLLLNCELLNEETVKSNLEKVNSIERKG